MQELTDAIVMVMNDIANEVGYDPEVKAQVIEVLAGRLHEINNVHAFYDIVEQLKDNE